MNLFRNLICGGLILCSAFSFAQPKLMSTDSLCKIHGVVFDKETNEPLAYAAVHIAGASRGAITDKNGFFSLSTFEKGKQRLVTSYISYAIDTLEVELYPGSRITQNVHLQPRAINVGGPAEIGNFYNYAPIRVRTGKEDRKQRGVLKTSTLSRHADSAHFQLRDADWNLQARYAQEGTSLKKISGKGPDEFRIVKENKRRVWVRACKAGDQNGFATLIYKRYWFKPSLSADRQKVSPGS